MQIKNYFERLPYLIRPDHVAHYEDGRVLILDRRIYPFERKFVVCDTYDDSAKAITDMVTQSGGPKYVVAYGMVQAAHACKGRDAEKQLEEMERAVKVLGYARPTNNNIKYQTERMLIRAKEVLAQGGDLEEAMLNAAQAMILTGAKRSMRVGIHAANQLHDGDGILTHCWAESSIVATFMAAQDQGKKLTAICSETRPYLQGARLTADAISELGIPTTVITDNMPGYVMRQGKIQAFFAGADRVTKSGHVINKIGTFQDALCCKYYDIPAYAFCNGPDPNAATDADVHIEERDPEETLYCLHVRTATKNVTGYYPAFDVTPPELLTKIITDRGVFEPDRIADYFDAPSFDD